MDMKLEAFDINYNQHNFNILPFISSRWGRGWKRRYTDYAIIL
jgi:hypothetical protein